MQWLTQKLLSPEDQTKNLTDFEDQTWEFKKEMRDSAKILIAVEILSPACMCWVSCCVSCTACSTVFGGTALPHPDLDDHFSYWSK